MAGFLLGVDAGGEVVGAELLIGATGGEHVPDDDDQFVGDGDYRLVFGLPAAETAEPARAAAVEGLEVSLGAHGGPRTLDESREAGDVRFLWLRALVWEDQACAVLATVRHDREADAGEAAGGQRPTQATSAPAHSGAGQVVEKCGARTPRLLRRTRRHRRGGGLPHPGNAPLVQGAAASQPAHADDLGADEPPREPMATTRKGGPYRDRHTSPSEKPHCLTAYASAHTNGEENVIVTSTRSGILVISQKPPPTHGSTVMTEVLIQSLEASGVPVTLVDRRFSSSLAEVGTFRIRKVWGALCLFARLVRFLVTERPSACVFFCTSRAGSFIVDYFMSEVLRAFGVPTVHYLHTQGYVELAQRGPIWNILVARLMGAASLTVCLSRRLAIDIEDWVQSEEIRIMPNTPHNLPLDLAPTVDPTRRSILFLSNLDPEKGPDTFIELAKAIGGDREHWDFHIAGATVDDDFTAHLVRAAGRAECADRIIFHGYVGRDEKWELLRSADVLVYPSTRDALPLTIIEAMAASTAVVAFDVGGISDIIINGQTGYVVALDSEDRMIEMVRALASDQSKLAKFGALARKEYLRKYSPETFGKGWIQILNDLLPIDR